VCVCVCVCVAVALIDTEHGVDTNFMSAFTTTYRSFTSPWKLFSKLVERFHVPEFTHLDTQRIDSIQFRVVVVFKYWVDTQFDFDDALMGHILSFGL
jgi:hypothetical protein